MIGLADACLDWMYNTVKDSNIFEDKVFDVYDPAILQSIAEKFNYPVCGIVYEGIDSVNQEFDQGVSSYLGVSIIILAESRERDIRQTADKDNITVLLDSLRNLIVRQISPTQHSWEFMLEIPMDLGDRGLVYYQKWRTGVIV